MIRARFAKYINPVLGALVELGGSGRPREVADLVVRDLAMSDDEVEELNRSGQSKFRNDVAWARHYLVADGCIDSSRRGVWSLTDKGRTRSLSDSDVNELVRRVQVADAQRRAAKPRPAAPPTGTVAPETEVDEEAPDEETSYRDELLILLKNLPPEGFERLCQRLLREAGFENVEVTGRSGDGGIDGIGLLQMNPFVSFKVLFQCKRFAGSVGPAVVRDFRGAMQGRADKGIILTTGTYTSEARREAVRDGVPPIELVDGEHLIAMFEQLELGLRPRTTYDIDPGFFREFQA